LKTRKVVEFLRDDKKEVTRGLSLLISEGS
jgi:hypothetical protein